MAEFNNLSQLQQVALLFIPFVFVFVLISQVALYTLKQKLASERNSRAWPSSQVVAAELSRTGLQLDLPLSAVIPNNVLFSSLLLDNIAALALVFERTKLAVSKIRQALRFVLIILIVGFYINVGVLIISDLHVRSVSIAIVNFYMLFLLSIIISGIDFSLRAPSHTALIAARLIDERLKADVNLYLFLSSFNAATLLYMFIPRFVSGLAHKPDSVR